MAVAIAVAEARAPASKAFETVYNTLRVEAARWKVLTLSGGGQWAREMDESGVNAGTVVAISF